jgi:aminopeptidase N
MLDLHQALEVDSISGSSFFQRQSDSLIIYLASALDAGDTFTVQIHYHGQPELAGGYKGLRYESHGNNEPLIATLSTPWLAHYWFPCKDGPADKADSVYVDITIPNRIYNNLPLKAISNGMLWQEAVSNETTTFSWRHRYPIVSYYIMMAISNYVLLEDSYCSDDHCFPLEYYVFAEDSAVARQGVALVPDMISLFENLFGPYPFRNEKYGMTQLGFYGAIENQTNSVINSLSPEWEMVIVHELAHMWFGCQITCSDWHHGWLNEGFATYAEALWKEYRYGFNAYSAYMAAKGWYQSGTVHLDETDDPFQIFIPIIYNKGAWVLHMLRSLMGDALFFDFLKNYASLPELEFGHVSTEQFQALAEDAFGSDLEWFFDQWVYDEYYPSYNYNYHQEGGLFQLQLHQMQGEQGRRPLFITPLDLRISFDDFSDTTIRIWNDQLNQYFSFSFDKQISAVELDPWQWLLHSATFNPELPVGINKQNRKEIFSIYPNPGWGSIMLETDHTFSLPATMTITGMKGDEILRHEILNRAQLINIQSLSEGIYLLRLQNTQGIVTRAKKLVIKR